MGLRIFERTQDEYQEEIAEAVTQSHQEPIEVDDGGDGGAFEGGGFLLPHKDEAHRDDGKGGELEVEYHEKSPLKKAKEAAQYPTPVSISPYQTKKTLVSEQKATPTSSELSDLSSGPGEPSDEDPADIRKEVKIAKRRPGRPKRATPKVVSDDPESEEESEEVYLPRKTRLQRH